MSETTDRELLVLAAKAAGYTLKFQPLAGSDLPICEELACSWNPLVDDGTALRLAVKLGFINPGQWPNPGDLALQQWGDTGDVDWCAATRRAIVRAAALIAQSTQPHQAAA